MEELRAILNCLVCKKTLSGIVALCRSGHSVCETCKARVSFCPTCREQLTGRSLAIQEIMAILPLACVNNQDGCSVKLSRREMAVHEVSCQYSKVTCVVESCESKWMASDYLAHVKSEHVELVHSLNRAKTVIVNVPTKHEYTMFVCCGQTQAVLPYIVKCSVDAAAGGLYFGIFTFGPAAQQCCYTAKLLTQDCDSVSKQVTLSLNTKLYPAKCPQGWRHSACCLRTEQLDIDKSDKLQLQLQLKSEPFHFENRFMERLTLYAVNVEQCYGQDNECRGCGEYFPGGYIKHHTRFCKETMVSCIACGNKIRLSDLHEHVTTSHSKAVVESFSEVQVQRVNENKTYFTVSNGKVTAVFHVAKSNYASMDYTVGLYIVDSALYIRQCSYTLQIQVGLNNWKIPLTPQLYPCLQTFNTTINYEISDKLKECEQMSYSLLVTLRSS